MAGVGPVFELRVRVKNNNMGERLVKVKPTSITWVCGHERNEARLSGHNPAGPSVPTPLTSHPSSVPREDAREVSMPCRV
jgi:hypothetical protein